MKTGTFGYSAITLLFLAVAAIPIPARFLDFLLALNIALSLFILLDILLSKQDYDFLSFPKILLALTGFNLANTIIAARLIISIGEEFDGRMICFIATPAASFGNSVLFACLFFLIICLAGNFFYITRKTCRLTETAATLYLEDRQEKYDDMENLYRAGLINEEEIAQRKNAIQEITDYFSLMEKAGKLISVNEKLRVFFILIIIAAGILSGVNLRGELSSNVINIYYVSLAIGSGIFSLIPSVLLSVAVWHVIRKSAGRNFIQSL